MRIRVFGTPIPQGSMSAFAIRKGGEYTGRTAVTSDNPRLRAWRAAVTQAAREVSRTPGPVWPEGVPVQLAATFFMPRPKSHYGTGRNAAVLKPSAPAWPVGVKDGDYDKLLRAVGDALQDAGIVANDSQFVGGPGGWRVYADYDQPGADIWVEHAPRGIPRFVMVDRGGQFGDSGRLVDFATGQPLTSGVVNLPDF